MSDMLNSSTDSYSVPITERRGIPFWMLFLKLIHLTSNKIFLGGENF